LLIQFDTWLSILPTALTARLYYVPSDFENRFMIWFDTWDMFADHPLTGIGLDSFQSYLIKTRPGVSNFYGIGKAQGVEYIPNQAENGYLTIFYEGGLAGSIAALLVVGDALRRALAVVVNRGTIARARSECIAALAGLLTFGGTFMTLFTASDARTAGMFAFFLAVIWHHSLQHVNVARKV